jgi:hypothetical protein
VRAAASSEIGGAFLGSTSPQACGEPDSGEPAGDGSTNEDEKWGSPSPVGDGVAKALAPGDAQCE